MTRSRLFMLAPCRLQCRTNVDLIGWFLNLNVGYVDSFLHLAGGGRARAYMRLYAYVCEKSGFSLHSLHFRFKTGALKSTLGLHIAFIKTTLGGCCG